MPPQKQVKKDSRAFTLVEAIVAIGIMMLVIAGATPVVLRALSATDDLQSRMIANFLAQEGLEMVRSQRDSNGIKELSGTDTAFDDGFAAACFTNTGCYVEFDTMNWNQCDVADGCSKIKYGADGTYDYAGGTATPFTRTITITRANDATNGSLQDLTVLPFVPGTASVPGADANNDTLLVTSSVSYVTRSGLAHSVSFQSYLFDIWRNDY